jgi:hypothetical protein
LQRAGREPGWSKGVFVGCGYVLAESHGHVHFQLNLFGKDVRRVPAEGHLWWLVDDVLLESTIAVAEQVGVGDARGTELLGRYMAWETEHAVRENGWPQVSPEGQSFQINGLEMLSWSYRFPTPLSTLDQQVFGMVCAAAAIEDVVFVLAAPLRHPDDIRPAVTVMVTALESLQRTEAPMDVEAVAQRLRADTAPWEGCPNADDR